MRISFADDNKNAKQIASVVFALRFYFIFLQMNRFTLKRLERLWPKAHCPYLGQLSVYAVVVNN